MVLKPELVEYIKKQLANGHDAATIRQHLLKHGYTEQTAEEGLQAAGCKPAPKKLKFRLLPKFSFSGKTVTIAVLIFILVGGMGFGLYQLFFASGYLAGLAAGPAATIPEVPDIEEIEETAAVEETAEEIEEIPEEEIATEEAEKVEEEETEQAEETTETEEQEETTTETVLAATGCTGNSACDSGYACYEKICVIDNDRDGLGDIHENKIGTDTLDQDSDDDGSFDYDEANAGTDPLDATSPGYTSCKNTNECASGMACSASGICISCKDSDALKYNKKGSTQGVHYTLGKALKTSDSCSSTEKLLEYYCTNDNYLYSKEIDCAKEYGQGYSCSDGKCVSG